ncbi:putative cysteine proteinase CG12163 [Caerostris darwini]|uniref:Cysteine proteinase CG12163 n=1 Tax=Caerostris darwini TaxID=1538125 RepID=A0AAV4VXX3_9ARAC|nr:putative cysteine proteinase CG12163 [Caerostris darwini]
MLRLSLLFVIPLVLATGQWQKVSVDDPGVQKAVQSGVRLLSQRSNSLYHSKLIEIHEAERQVVAGLNYRVKLSVGYTKCKKSQVKFEDVATCDLLEGPLKICDLVIYRNLKGEHKLTKFDCHADPEARSAPQNAHQLHAEKLLFDDFVARHGKEYKDDEEKQMRFKVFQQNLQKIKFLNDHERGTARYGTTKFADWTEEEFKKKALGLRPDLMESNDILPKAVIPNAPLPDSFDWRDKKIVTEVKDQGQCGSCWAFSTTGNIEGQWALKGKGLVSLSEQELVDCDKLDQGCNGGLQTNAYKEIIRLGGLETESAYPYDGKNDKCTFAKSKVKVYINSSLTISTNETEMQQWLVKNGPIAIGINANAMQFYYGGISHPWKFLCDPGNLDHGVLIVGYGVHTYPIFKKTLPFWIIKNSWGPSWGEQGYYRVYRGDGTCGLNMMTSSSVVN